MNTGAPEPVEDLADGDDTVGLAEVGSDPDTPVLVPLEMPAEGVPDVVVDERAPGRGGPGHRRRARSRSPSTPSAPPATATASAPTSSSSAAQGSGTWLIDPIACPDLAPVAEAIADAEWVLHAATPGPALPGRDRHAPGAAVRHRARRPAGRAAPGRPRPPWSSSYLGLSLAKEHSAVDWSTRPLPEPWLRYAALDVEVLIELRDALAADLAEQGKLEWAHEEFEALARLQPAPPRQAEPWRRTSGMHRVRNRRGSWPLVRELWQARDTSRRSRDVSPGRVLPDAGDRRWPPRPPPAPAAAGALPGFPGRGRPPASATWLAAIRRAPVRCPTPSCRAQRCAPTVRRRPGPGPTATRSPAPGWPRPGPRWPTWPRAHRCRSRTCCRRTRVRRVLWTPPEPADVDAVGAALRELGARPWQVELVAPVIVAAVAAHPDDEG